MTRSLALLLALALLLPGCGASALPIALKALAGVAALAEELERASRAPACDCGCPTARDASAEAVDP